MAARHYSAPLQLSVVCNNVTYDITPVCFVGVGPQVKGVLLLLSKISMFSVCRHNLHFT